MPQIKSGNKQYLITDDGQTYTLAQGAKRSATNTDAAIQINPSSSDTMLEIAGKVSQTNMAFAAIVVSGHDNTVRTAETGIVTGNTGIEIVSNHSRLINAGTVASHTVGAQAVYSEGKNLHVVNTGQITSDGGSALTLHGLDNHVANNSIIQGDVGIELWGGDNTIMIGAHGSITATSVAISLDNSENGGPNDTTRIVNAGEIVCTDGFAISAGNAAETVMNKGTIEGTIDLGAGNDVFDTRHGTTSGKIFGGDGDDTFYVSKSSTKIVEGVGEGTDTVYSSASYHLTDGVENLKLIGLENLTGVGTKEDNTLSGNKGANVLTGLNGNDVLDGGRGNDMLEGDLGTDVFVLNTGSGNDTVSDFHDGEDFIRSNVVSNQSDFDGLTITQTNTDVVIDFGHGDTLTLQNFDKANLTFADFQTVM